MSNDETQPTSGSRWEEQPSPTEQSEQPEQPAPPAVAEVPTPPPAPVPAAPTPAAATPSALGRNRGKLMLAGGAVGVALVAGTGGFALGHATAGDDRDEMGRFGGPGSFQGNLPGRPDGGPMGGQQNGPPGTFPGQPGQPPHGFGDRRDDDDDQPQPDDGATEGSTSNS